MDTIIEKKKTASSVRDVLADKPPFGSRYLTPDVDVWSKNAWDHVPPPDDQDDRITTSLARQRARPVPEDEKPKYNDKPAKHWDNFYKMNADNFFRDRKWLHTEFPELVEATQADAGPMTIAELGCGAGNSVFPLLASNKNPQLSLFAFDYASHAVKLVQHSELYASPPVGSIHASVWDITSRDGLPDGISPSSVDIVVLVFVLSALHPAEWVRAVSNIYKMLKPGGLVVMRDYGRHDLTQLRFKEGRLLDDNFYIRGDKTRVYFFELDELALLFTGQHARPSDNHPTDPQVVYEDDGDEAYTVPPTDEFRTLTVSSNPSDESRPSDPSLTTSSTPSSASTTSPHLPPLSPPPSHPMPAPKAPVSAPHPILLSPDTNAPPGCPPHPLFATEQLGVDRRLLVNRKRQLKMYRVWMQGKFKKLPSTDVSHEPEEKGSPDEGIIGERQDVLVEEETLL